MYKCQQCKDKDVELLTRWERLRAWLFEKVNHIFFADDFDDLRSAKYTQGFSDGTTDGAKYERLRIEKEQALYSIQPQPLTEDQVSERLASLLTNVDLNKVISIDKPHGIIMIGGEKADQARLNNLRAEAEFILQSDIWTILYETPKQLAQKEMFVTSNTIEVMQKGRAVLFLLSQQKNIIDILKNVNK